MAFSNVTFATMNRQYVAPSMRSIPTLEGGNIRIANQRFMRFHPYQDSILLMGHADTYDGVYEPMPVINVADMLNYLRKPDSTEVDENSPLVRALLEVVDGGCQNVAVYPVAPMEEYVNAVDLSLRFEDEGDGNFYEKYHTRLSTAYANMLEWGNLNGFGIIVPVEAPFYDTQGVDFCGQLINFCVDYFGLHGNALLGVMGTRIAQYNQDAIDALVSDDRVDIESSTMLESGKFVMVVVGEGIIGHRDTSLTHNSSLSTQAAINLATYDLKRSITGSKLKGCVNLAGIDITDEQAQTLALARLNPVVRTKKGRRGFTFETKLLTDNTMSGFANENFNADRGSIGTNFWSMAQMHLVAAVINQIKQYGETLIGERLIDSDNFKSAVQQLLVDMRDNDYIRNFSLNIETVTKEYKLIVSVGLQPVFGIRNIYFQVDAGPGGT